jgi:hypothetical protein
MIATIKPRDIVGKTRRRLAVELITELEAIDKKIKGVKLELRELIAARGSTLIELTGIGPSGRPGCWSTLATSTALPTATSSPPGTALHPWTPPPVTRNVTGSPGPGTGASTGHCTSWPSSNCGTRPKDVPTSTPRRPPARPRWSPCARSNDASPTSSTPTCSPINNDVRRRAREGNRDTTLTPARPVHIPTPALRTSHFPDPSHPSLGPPSSEALDLKGSLLSVHFAPLIASCRL